MFAKEEILRKAGILEQYPEYSLLEDTAENIAAEINDQIEHKIVDSSTITITRNYIYEKYVLEKLGYQLLNNAYNAKTFYQNMNLILGKLARHMLEKKTDTIIEDLRVIFPPPDKITLIQDYLNTCPLVAKDSSGNYQFQAGLDLKGYFHILLMYKELQQSQDLTKNQPDPVYSLFNSIPSSDPVLQNIKQKEEVSTSSKFKAIKAKNQELKKASQENNPSHPQQSFSPLYSLLNDNIPIDNENSAITLVHDANGKDPGNGFLIIENMEKSVRSINLYRIDISTNDVVVFTNKVLDEQKFYNEMMRKNCYAVTCSVPKNEKIKFDITNSGIMAELNPQNFTTGNKTLFQGYTGQETAFEWARSMILKFIDDRPDFIIHSGVSSFKEQQQTKNITSDILEKTNNSKEGFKKKIQRAVDKSNGAALLSMLTNQEKPRIDYCDISYEAKDVILKYINSPKANDQDKKSFCEGLTKSSLLKDLFEKKARYFRSPQPDRGHLKEALDLKKTFEQETELTPSPKR